MRLRLRHISRAFGDVQALDDVSLDIRPGEIISLLGENGAGKSTLMNVAFGLVRPDSGVIEIDGVEQHLASPADALEAGIGMVHQHFMLIGNFTVTENVTLGREPRTWFGWIRRNVARAYVQQAAHGNGIDVDPNAMTDLLPVGVRQRVEILKVLTRDAQVVILDEPTAVLTPQETDVLLDAIRAMRDSGKAVVFISHKLREVRSISDRIVVMRHGRIVRECAPDATEDELAHLMVGRDVVLTADRGEPNVGPVRIEIDDLSLSNPEGRAVLRGVSFQVRAGEIVGIAGVEGNGQSELVRCIQRLLQPTEGRIRIDGTDILTLNTHQVLDMGVGIVSEDRSREGIIAAFTVAENLALERCQQPPITRLGVMRPSVMRHMAQELMEAFDIRPRKPDEPAGQLSGGNQQKVVVARALATHPRSLVLAQPTRGLDVGSIESVHRHIVSARDGGAAVVLVSAELDEIIALSDRILVMYEGRIVGELPSGSSRREIGMLMSGARTGSAA